MYKLQHNQTSELDYFDAVQSLLNSIFVALFLSELKYVTDLLWEEYRMGTQTELCVRANILKGEILTHKSPLQ